MTEHLWCEKYRPKTIDDCILPKSLKKKFTSLVKRDDVVQNFIFTGTAGTGKTTVAKALCDELGLDWILINASDESGIDVLRTKIRDFASTMSMVSDKHRVVILDEADYMNPNSLQPALRGFMEEFAENCRFILTCNYLNRIIDPLHSRCSIVEFKIPNDEVTKLQSEVYNRVIDILINEDIAVGEDAKVALIKFVAHRWPDLRRIINETQRACVRGKLDAEYFDSVADSIGSVDGLVDVLRERNFKTMRKWVGENSDVDFDTIYSTLYESMYSCLNPKSIPEAVVILADYQYKSALVPDKQLNFAACMVEIMTQCEFVK